MYDWQDVVLQAAMGERSDGRWASRFVGVAAPRQNGKTYLIVARALAGILLFGEREIIVSAHQTDTARESFQRLLDVIEANPSVEKRVQQVFRAFNREFIKFKGGPQIRFKARAADTSRGFSADCLLLDEAQIFAPQAAAALFPTMAARPNAQAWLLGTPSTGGADGEMFTRLRESGHSGTDKRLTWAEWSPDDGDDLRDPAVWAKTNPAWGVAVTAETLEPDLSVMTEDQFWAEHCGGWPDELKLGVFGSDWSRCVEPMPTGLPMSGLALASSFDLDKSALVASAVVDDRVHVKPLHSAPGTDWVLPRIIELQRAHDVPLVVDPKGPASALIPDLERAGVDLRIVESKDVYVACAGIVEAVRSHRLAHGAYPELDREVEVAKKRPVGDRWAWDRKAGIPNVEAATLALWAAENPVEQQEFVSAYESAGLEVV